MICVTGVSGSGKSTLINDTLYPILSQMLYKSNKKPLDYKTIKGYVDISFGVDYRYSKVLSVFLNLNNITASKYSRWYNYPSYTFGAMAGLSYSF